MTPFLEELNQSAVAQISIEAAKPDIDPSLLASIPYKEIVHGVVPNGDLGVEPADLVARRIRDALAFGPPEGTRIVRAELGLT